jgi:hypothetical protein
MSCRMLIEPWSKHGLNWTHTVKIFIKLENFPINEKKKLYRSFHFDVGLAFVVYRVQQCFCFNFIKCPCFGRFQSFCYCFYYDIVCKKRDVAQNTPDKEFNKSEATHFVTFHALLRSFIDYFLPKKNIFLPFIHSFIHSFLCVFIEKLKSELSFPMMVLNMKTLFFKVIFDKFHWEKLFSCYLLLFLRGNFLLSFFLCLRSNSVFMSPRKL